MLVAGTASGHTGGSTGYASIVVTGSTVRYSLTLSPLGLPRDIAEDIALARTGHALPRQRLLRLIREKVTLRGGAMRCVPGPSSIGAPGADGESLTLVVDYACPASMPDVVIRDDVFDGLGPDHHTLARVEVGSTIQQFAFAPDVREARIVLANGGGSPDRGTASFFLLGVHHILSGYDHLLFVLALLLRGGTWLGLLKIVTAFTLAHSLTLTLAVLQIVMLPDRLIEAVIALSIAIVAAENLRPRPALARRWIVSFLFGLVHGFGFSSALRELGLPRHGLAASLLGFNLGVEAGQALVIAALLPGLVLLRRTTWETRTVVSSSVAILITGLILFVERVLL
jgi:hydrogenase/urease accessory protein HupE